MKITKKENGWNLVEFDDFEMKEINMFKEKWEKESSISKIYDELTKSLNAIEQIQITLKVETEIHTTSAKADILIIILQNKLKGNFDKAYFLSKARDWLSTRVEFTGLSIWDIQKICEVLLDERTAKSLENVHRMLCNYLPNYKKNVYEGTKSEDIVISEICSKYFISIYKFFYPLINNDEIINKLSDWKSEINEIFNVMDILQKYYPDNTSIKKNSEDYYWVKNINYAYANFLTLTQKDKRKEITKKINESAIRCSKVDDDFKLPILAAPRFIAKDLWQMDATGNTTNKIQMDYLINSYGKIRESLMSEESKSFNAFQLEEKLITAVSLCEKVFFTFVKLIEDHMNPFPSRDISPTSKKFIEKLKPIINQNDQFTYTNDLKIAFLNKTFQIWADNDFGQNYKSNSKSLRNIVVHRNPMYEGEYNILNLKKDIQTTFSFLSEYISILIYLSILFPFRNEEILSDRSFSAITNIEKSPDDIVKARNQQFKAFSKTKSKKR